MQLPNLHNLAQTCTRFSIDSNVAHHVLAKMLLSKFRPLPHRQPGFFVNLELRSGPMPRSTQKGAAPFRNVRTIGFPPRSHPNEPNFWPKRNQAGRGEVCAAQRSFHATIWLAGNITLPVTDRWGNLPIVLTPSRIAQRESIR